ncbi:tetratricopeptide repeat protein [Roseivirga sp. BDSF3-8]|uniref:tetratricopeptide repeat protein n=1 Tax=Roseivirga sp. BDSF3-8 TaxID=3241598 RepID=UPI003531F27A
MNKLYLTYSFTKNMYKVLTGLLVLLSITFGCNSSGQQDKSFETFNEGVSYSLDAESAAQEGNPEKAEELHRKAIVKFDETLAADPDHAPALSAMGHSHFMLREFDQCLEWYEKALALDSANVPAHLEYGLCRINLGDIRSGKVAIDKAIALDHNSRETVNHAVDNLLDIGTLAFDYGNGYMEEGDSVKGTDYKRFAVGVLYTAHQTDTTRQEVIRYLVDFSEKTGNEELRAIFSEKLHQ